MMPTSHSYETLIIGLFVLLKVDSVTGVTCGGYVQATASSTGVVHSPRYPSNYDNDVTCIWLLEAKKGYSISLTIEELQLESSASSCVDYIEIRNGSSAERVLYRGCEAATPITTKARWLWIKFYSNYVNTSKGFTSSWSVVSDSSTALLKEPFIDCPLEYKCPNKECIPWSYRCDNYSDCGCEDDGCDETGCGGLTLASTWRLAIGISAGTIVFIVVFFGIGLLDIYLKKRADRLYQERLEKQKRLQKQHKAREMAKLLVTQSSTDGSRISGSRMSASTAGFLGVPSNNTINGSLTSVKI